MEAESRAENIQEFLGVAAEFEETHEDIEGTLESLEELRAAGVAGVPEAGAAGAAGAVVAAGAGTPMQLDDAMASAAGALVGALASPAMAVAPAPNAAAIAAAEVERTYGPLACKALPALLEWLALRSDLDALAGDTHAITMMTVHSAKGLEFPAVFVAGMEESIFPHVAGWTDDDPAKLEEERRLAYVAITRARKRLFLTYAATRRTYGSTQANPRSRFVNEIPAEHIEFSGIGSSGFSGTGWEKRGDRRGTFGSGQGSDMYGGRVFGSFTRSTPGTQRRTSISPDAGRVGTGSASAFGEGSGAGAGRSRSTFGSGAPRPKKTNVSATVERKVDAAAAATTFAAGDRVSHKTFGPGTVISAAGDMIEVQFERNGQTKKLMKGFAPIVKLT